MLLHADAERRYVQAILMAAGATEPHAAAAADVVVEADLRGNSGQGLLRVPQYAARLQSGELNGDPRPRVIREHAATALVDGDRALGAYAAIIATREAIARARRMGAAAVGVFNCGHTGMVGYYPELAARENLIGMLFGKSEAHVHPHGGLERLLGTNPLAVAIPTEEEPFLLDMATSAISAGKVIQAAAAGLPIPAGTAVDQDGHITTDATLGQAGALSALGGAKGYGLGLVLELLGGVLTGAGTGPMQDAAGRQLRLWGTLILVVDPTAFTDLATFKRTTSAYLHRVRDSRKAPDVSEILVPGQRAYRTRQLQLTHGSEIGDRVWREVAALARGLGLDPAAYVSGGA